MGSLLILLLLIVAGVLLYLRSQRDKPGSRLFSMSSVDTGRSAAEEWGNGGWIVEEEDDDEEDLDDDDPPAGPARGGTPRARA